MRGNNTRLCYALSDYIGMTPTLPHYAVQLHWRDAYTVRLLGPITNMTRTLSYWCSNRAGGQSRSRFLLKFSPLIDLILLVAAKP